MIVVVGLSHKSAPIEVRECLSVPPEALPGFLLQLHACPELTEVVAVSTCNRVEIYATARASDVDGSHTAAAIEHVLAEKSAHLKKPIEEHLFRYTGDSAVRHLFRVAASLDSLVVGEAQILGQVKAAFDAATQTHTVGLLLSRAMESAFHVAKRIRTETQIGSGSVSVSSVAVELAKQIFGDLEDRVVALLGAGKMGVAAAKPLCDSGARLTVVNRSLEKAKAVAARFQGKALGWDELQKALVDSDVIIASTGASCYVLTRKMLENVRKARRGRSLFVIDISVPRNVEPSVNELDGVYLYDIDDLSRIASESLRGRLTEAQHAERIVDEEARAFEAWVGALEVTPTIVALREQVKTVLSAELQKSLNGKLKHLTDTDKKALDGMIAAAVNKLTHTPVMRLKSSASEGTSSELIHVLCHLFDLPDPAVSPCKLPQTPEHLNGGSKHPEPPFHNPTSSMPDEPPRSPAEPAPPEEVR